MGNIKKDELFSAQSKSDSKFEYKDVDREAFKREATLVSLKMREEFNAEYMHKVYENINCDDYVLDLKCDAKVEKAKVPQKYAVKIGEINSFDAWKSEDSLSQRMDHLEAVFSEKGKNNPNIKIADAVKVKDISYKQDNIEPLKVYKSTDKKTNYIPIEVKGPKEFKCEAVAFAKAEFSFKAEEFKDKLKINVPAAENLNSEVSKVEKPKKYKEIEVFNVKTKCEIKTAEVKDDFKIPVPNLENLKVLNFKAQEKRPYTVPVADAKLNYASKSVGNIETFKVDIHTAKNLESKAIKAEKCAVYKKIEVIDINTKFENRKIESEDCFKINIPHSSNLIPIDIQTQKPKEQAKIFIRCLKLNDSNKKIKLSSNIKSKNIFDFKKTYKKNLELFDSFNGFLKEEDLNIDNNVDCKFIIPKAFSLKRKKSSDISEFKISGKSANVKTPLINFGSVKELGKKLYDKENNLGFFSNSKKTFRNYSLPKNNSAIDIKPTVKVYIKEKPDLLTIWKQVEGL